MRADWHALHEDLLRRMNRHGTHEAFGHLRAGHDVLRPFRDPVALIDWLHGRQGMPDAKNSALEALVREAQASPAHDDTGRTLLTLALWPGLDAIYRRRLRQFPRDPNALASEIGVRLLSGIHDMDRSRVSRIAATLLRNIDRDIGRLLRAHWRDAERHEPAEALEQTSSEPIGRMHDGPEARIDRDRIFRVLGTILGADAGLVIDIAVLGLTQREAAERHGLSHEAARKRYQRALEKIRAQGIDW